jgi:hypothetical protein
MYVDTSAIINTNLVNACLQIKEKIGMAHSSLTNLQRLLEVTSTAMIETKTQLNTVRSIVMTTISPYLRVLLALIAILATGDGSAPINNKAARSNLHSR